MVTARVGVYLHHARACVVVVGVWWWIESIDTVEDICLHALSSIHSVFLIVNKMSMTI